MPYVTFLLCMTAGTVLAWGAWFAVLFNVNPDESGLVGYAAFYVTLFIALMGTVALIGTVIRVHVLKRGNVVLREVKIAVRHAVLASLMAVASLFLSVSGWFTWWTFALLLAAIGALEYVALLIQESKRA